MRIETFVNSACRMRDGLADIRVRTEDGQEHQMDLPFGDLYRRCGLPSSMALDLLITASICYMIDKTVPRASAIDGWTRELQVRLPVSDPQCWAQVGEELARTLTFLTGDLWSLEFFSTPQPMFQDPEGNRLPLTSSTQAVSLFSGGLDSLAGAIDLLSAADTGRILLIGHYDSSGPRKVQSVLAAKLTESFPNRFDIEHVRVAHRPEKAAEETLRSRSLVFIALGLYAAQAFGPRTPLYMFENGLIALNIPLTPSRNGSCSTRTMHPYYLHRLRAILRALGITNEIINPYALKTKGECITECKCRDVLVRLVDTSVSCSHASRRQQWARRDRNNCGYCVPCLFRRAALYKAGLDDGQQYGLDVLAGELGVEDELVSADDLRAVSDFIQQPLTSAMMHKKLITVAQFPDLDSYALLACRGFAEVKTWLANTADRVAATTHA